MITKIEIDGFKSFDHFEMTFTPLTVIAGTNASGKSNLFDALHLLSRLSQYDLKTAFSEERGEPIELFRQLSNKERTKEIRFGVEMLVNKKVKDNWGSEVDLKYTRLRYDLTIGRQRDERGVDVLNVKYESLISIKHNDDTWIKKFIKPANREAWRPKVASGRRGKPYIETIEEKGMIHFKIPQDGKAGGRSTPGNAVAQTILSSINSVDFPHAFAAREEMRKWTFLQLNPEKLRQPSKYLAESHLSQDGQNLASTLFRIKQEDSYALTEISQRVSEFIPGAMRIDVFDDKEAQQYVVRMESSDGTQYSSRVLSEGTLRLLVMLLFEYDDDFDSVLSFEEPENGIHPGRIGLMIQILKNISVDFDDHNMPLRQVIVNTHSPTLVSEALRIDNQECSVWFSRMVKKKVQLSNSQKVFLRSTKVFPVIRQNTTLFDVDDTESKVTEYDVRQYLDSVERIDEF
jgi:predicted ATPase